MNYPPYVVHVVQVLLFGGFKSLILLLILDWMEQIFPPTVLIYRMVYFIIHDTGCISIHRILSFVIPPD